MRGVENGPFPFISIKVNKSEVSACLCMHILHMFRHNIAMNLIRI